MGTKYADLSPSGYDANSPSDDGSITDANKVKWATHISKIGDPLNNWIQAINDSLITFANTSPVARSSAYTTTVTDNLVPIEVTGTTTISLGDAATLGSGTICPIYNADSSLLTTVDLATSGDTLDGSADGSQVLNPGEATTFIVNAGADGYLSIGNVGAKLGSDNTFTGVNDFSGATLTLAANQIAGSKVVIASETTRGSVEFATIEEMEAASSGVLAVVPSRVVHNPGVAKAWVNFDGTTGAVVTSSHNVDSVTDNGGTGLYTINFITDMADTNYSFVGTSGKLASEVIPKLVVHDTDTFTKTTSAFQIAVETADSGGRADQDSINVIIFGAQ